MAVAGRSDFTSRPVEPHAQSRCMINTGDTPVYACSLYKRSTQRFSVSAAHGVALYSDVVCCEIVLFFPVL